MTTTTTTRTRALLGAVVVASSLAGCATTSTAGPRSTEQPSHDSSSVPADPDRDTGRGSAGSELVLHDVRVVEGRDRDRVVLELRGHGRPGWTAEYVDSAVLEGSGRVVDLGGDAVLDLHASGTTWPAPGYYSGPTRIAPRGDGPVREVYVAGTFEGWTQVLVGTDGEPAPFRVRFRTGPPRVVVDVLDAD